jgi:ParB-like chromosome segregation protein Spo0J
MRSRRIRAIRAKNDGAVEAVARSIREFGFRQPIILDKPTASSCGHTSWKAAQHLGLAEVPVHVARPDA